MSHINLIVVCGTTRNIIDSPMEFTRKSSGDCLKNNPEYSGNSESTK